METPKQAIDRINREMWQPIRDEHQAVHRGFGVELSDEDHALVHDKGRPLHERAARLMEHVSKGHTREDYGWGGDLGGPGLGIHWTTDANVAHHFAKINASHRTKHDGDADGERYGYNADGFPRQRPETRIVLHAHFPEHEHIAHDEEDQDGAFGWDVRNTLHHTENGGGVPGGFEREVPIKRGQPVRVHAISWGLASHRGDDQADHDRETTRYDFPQTMVREASRRDPHERLFGPTYGLDHRLFDGEHLKPQVREWVLDTLNDFWQPLYGKSWYHWARVYFCGSEASEWTSPNKEGNGDFDVLIGIDFEAARKGAPSFDGLTDDQIIARLNADLTTLLWPRLLDVFIPVGKKKEGPFSATFFCNAKAWDIRDIKPYAAYNVTSDCWAVKPPHLPGWSLAQFPQGPALLREMHAVAAYARAILAMPEPYRTQQADALWRHIHTDRGRSFTERGEGWWDSGNVLEKTLDQLGLWEKLTKLHFDAQADPRLLEAPAGWSNDPRPAA